MRTLNCEQMLIIFEHGETLRTMAHKSIGGLRSDCFGTKPCNGKPAPHENIHVNVNQNDRSKHGKLKTSNILSVCIIKPSFSRTCLKLRYKLDSYRIFLFFNYV